MKPFKKSLESKPSRTSPLDRLTKRTKQENMVGNAATTLSSSVNIHPEVEIPNKNVAIENDELKAIADRAVTRFKDHPEILGVITAHIEHAEKTIRDLKSHPSR